MEVTQVQWTENIIKIISTATMFMLRMLTPRPSLLDCGHTGGTHVFIEEFERELTEENIKEIAQRRNTSIFRI